MARVIVILLPVIVIAVFAILAFIIYFAVYKRRINQTVVEDKPMKKPMTEPKNVAYILLIIAAVVVILSSMRAILFYVPSNSSISDLQVDINNLEQRVDELEDELMIKESEEESLIESADSTVIDFNTKTHTAKVKISVILKTVEKDTQMAVSIGKKETELKKSGATTFEGTCEVDIFGDYCDDTYIVITQNGKSTAHSCEDLLLDTLYMQCLPSIYNIDTNYKDEKSSYKKLHLNISFDIKVSDTKFAKFKSGTFKLAVYKNDELVYEESVPDVGSGKIIGIDKEFDFAKNDNFLVYLLAQDTAGFTHKIPLHSREELDKSGNAAVIGDSFSSEEIYDKNGKLLVEADYDE